MRGITSNPSIFQKAISGGADYEAQFRALLEAGTAIEDSYWQLVSKDIADALAILRPVYDDSMASTASCRSRSTRALPATPKARSRRRASFIPRSTQPNLYVKIPATAEGVPAIRQMIAEGRSINVTLIF